MFNSTRVLIKANTNSIKYAEKFFSYPSAIRSFASMTKFDYQDALNLECLLTEEEKMVFYFKNSKIKLFL